MPTINNAEKWFAIKTAYSALEAGHLPKGFSIADVIELRNVLFDMMFDGWGYTYNSVVADWFKHLDITVHSYVGRNRGWQIELP